MDRRGFLKLAGWTVPATVVLNSLPADGFDRVVIAPDLRAATAVSAKSLDIVDFEAMTRRVALAMAASMPYRVESLGLDDIRRLGEDIADLRFADKGSVAMTSQLNRTIAVPLRLPTSGYSLAAAILDQHGENLARQARERGLTVFAPLILPKGVQDTVNVRLEHGPTVRGVVAYDIADDSYIYRFDTLGACCL